MIAGVDLYVHVRKSHNPGPLGFWFVAILLATAPLGWLVARFFAEPLNRRLRSTRESAVLEQL